MQATDGKKEWQNDTPWKIEKGLDDYKEWVQMKKSVRQ